MVFRDCNSSILNDFKRFLSLRPRTVFCMVSFVEKICVLAHREIRDRRGVVFDVRGPGETEGRML